MKHLFLWLCKQIWLCLFKKDPAEINNKSLQKNNSYWPFIMSAVMTPLQPMLKFQNVTAHHSGSIRQWLHGVDAFLRLNMPEHHFHSLSSCGLLNESINMDRNHFIHPITAQHQKSVVSRNTKSGRFTQCRKGNTAKRVTGNRSAPSFSTDQLNPWLKASTGIFRLYSSWPWNVLACVYVHMGYMYSGESKHRNSHDNTHTEKHSSSPAPTSASRVPSQGALPVTHQVTHNWTAPTALFSIATVEKAGSQLNKIPRHKV